MASVTFKPSNRIRGLPTSRPSLVTIFRTHWHRLFPAQYARSLNRKIGALDRTAESMGRVAWDAAMNGQSDYFKQLVREKVRVLAEADALRAELDAFLGAL